MKIGASVTFGRFLTFGVFFLLRMAMNATTQTKLFLKLNCKLYSRVWGVCILQLKIL